MHASVTALALLSVPSTFMIDLGFGSVFRGSPYHSAVCILTKFSVAPLSISARAVSLPCECSKFTLMYKELCGPEFTLSTDTSLVQII